MKILNKIHISIFVIVVFNLSACNSGTTSSSNPSSLSNLSLSLKKQENSGVKLVPVEQEDVLITDSSANQVLMFGINKSSKLEPLKTPPIPTDGGIPSAIHIDPSEKYAYVNNSSDILIYSRIKNGELSQINTTSIQGNPTSLLIYQSPQTEYSCEQPESVVLDSMATGILSGSASVGFFCDPSPPKSGESSCYYGNYSANILISGLPSMAMTLVNDAYYSLNEAQYIINQKVIHSNLAMIYQDYDTGDPHLSCLYLVTGAGISPNANDSDLEFSLDGDQLSSTNCVVTGRNVTIIGGHTSLCQATNCQLICNNNNRKLNN